MKSKTLGVTGAATLVVLIGVWVWVVPLWLVSEMPTQPTSVSEWGLLTEAEAIARAVEHATRRGLQGEPQGVVACQMTLGEAVKMTSGGEVPDEAKAVGSDPNMPVWLVSIRGSVHMVMPGCDAWFDGVFVVIDASTGDWKSLGGIYDPSQLPIPVP